MKIIGKTETGYLCDVPEHDLQSLVGVSWGWGNDGIALLKELGIPMDVQYGQESPRLMGATIPITNRFRRVVEIESRHKDLVKTAGTFRQIADLIDQLSNAVIVQDKAESK